MDEPIEPADAELATLLRAERPEPDPGWAARLDERAAAGFPRGGRDGGQAPRRAAVRLAPAGAVAALLVVVVVAIDNAGTPGGGGDAVDAGPAPTATTVAPDQPAGGPADAMYERRDSSGLDAISPAARVGGRIAPGTANRKVDRDAQLSLSTRPDEVRPVTDEVISITRSLDGIVASSQVSETPDGASASLELTIPTRNLGTALDRMTDLADVDSLNETAVDITRPVVSAKDRLQDAEARRRELLQALGNAQTETEAAAIERRIADARREIARAEAAYERLTLKARLSDLAVSVTSNPAASDHRTLGDWIDDAVGVLRTIAGVLLVAAAALVPLALIAAIIALATARVRRRRRERALDG